MKKNILKNKLLVAGVLTASMLSGQAMAAGEVDAIFGAIDLSSIAASVGAVGVLIIGIAMVMKAITLGKRAVDKA
ncbi:phage coat protein [Aliivibrio wodanis]|uniref:phage coat protein n=1 Tax=Aliivibrio wodanis TaxID=80852 RepID=UPI00406C4357